MMVSTHSASVRIPFLGGRPKRDTIIQNDEILNMVIILNTTNSVNEFLEKMKEME